MGEPHGEEGRPVLSWVAESNRLRSNTGLEDSQWISGSRRAIGGAGQRNEKVSASHHPTPRIGSDHQRRRGLSAPRSRSSGSPPQAIRKFLSIDRDDPCLAAGLRLVFFLCADRVCCRRLKSNRATRGRGVRHGRVGVFFLIGFGILVQAFFRVQGKPKASLAAARENPAAPTARDSPRRPLLPPCSHHKICLSG